MRFIYLVSIILLSSCASKNHEIVDRQKAIKTEMDQVKAAYYKMSDSLEGVKNAETNSAKQLEIAEALVSAERRKVSILIPLQREYDSLELELQKY